MHFHLFFYNSLAIDSNEVTFRMSRLKRKMQKALILYPCSFPAQSGTFILPSWQALFKPVFLRRLNYAFVNLLCFVCYIIYGFYFHNLFLLLIPFSKTFPSHLLLLTIKCCMFAQRQIYQCSYLKQLTVLYNIQLIFKQLGFELHVSTYA